MLTFTDMKLAKIQKYLKFEPICLKSGLFIKVENGIGVCSPSRLTLERY
jgi:hypothetical protein